MLKNILSLNGAQQLSKNDQKSINGGWACVECPKGCHCVRGGACVSNEDPTSLCLSA